MKAHIDPKAGFCGGVNRAIEMAERILRDGGKLTTRGELIHNRMEMDRLYGLGLENVANLEQIGDRPVLVRTHGEENSFFTRAQQLRVQWIDATCPKVKRSQRVIHRAFEAHKQIIIVGRLNHPEVIALQGHCNSQAIIVNREQPDAQIDPTKPTLLIAQTTVSPELFSAWQEQLQRQIPDLEIFDSRCSFVTRRQKELAEFASKFPVIVFVGGRHSSNTALLANVCRQVNPNTHLVENENELQALWFQDVEHVGISGSASTPMWLLRKVADEVETLFPTTSVLNSQSQSLPN